MAEPPEPMPGPRRPKWEYFQIVGPDDPDSPNTLEHVTKAGADGWELVTILPVGGRLRWVFKRQAA